MPTSFPSDMRTILIRHVTAGTTLIVKMAVPLLAWLAVPLTVQAQMPVFLPGQRTNPIYSTERRDALPHWLELPRDARIRTGDGIEMTPLHNSAISLENLKLGVLVGALRNDGACASDLSARLQYVDQDWQPMGPAIPNEARVSRVEPGGILPYKFRLRTIADAKVPPSAYIVIIEEYGKPIVKPYTSTRWVSSGAQANIDRSPCPTSETRLEAVVTKRLPLREGFLLEGTTTLLSGGPVRADGVVLTAVLRDRKNDVLEVLVGAPSFTRRGLPTGVLEAGQELKFRLHTVMPLGREVAHADVMVELLPDAQVAGR